MKNKNLILRISNGFGNQMFLYASAYAFSKKLGYNLLIDDETGVKHNLKNWNKKKILHWKPKYELGIFNLQSNIAEDKYKFLDTKGYLKRKYLRLIDKIYTKKNFLIEKTAKDKKILCTDEYFLQKYQNTIFFEGYFESENYFKEYRNDLLKEFTFKSNPNLRNNKYIRTIVNSNVVSIAFRSRRYTEKEGDEKDESKRKKTSDFNDKTFKYILRGVEYFKSKINNPIFLLWSDSFDNLDNYFNPKEYIFVKNEEESKIFLDFFLMCQCKYFIVGPTSFHWWSAWLCNDKKKIIVCPKDPELNVSTNTNFWPESWIKI